MMKKKKIRKEFDAIFKSGDQTAIKNILEKHPWLLEEMSDNMGEELREQDQILAALGVMEDDLGQPVPIQEIIFSLKEDFGVRKSNEQVLSHLMEAEKLDLVKKEPNGWSLTESGGEICDNYLNKRFINLDK